MMSIYPWQLTHPITAVAFDCDGTLSAIEGIDELAKHNHVEDIVQRLTQEAMGKCGMSVDLYQQRLDLVQPTAEQIIQLGDAYIANRVPDIQAVIAVLQRLQKTIYIVSAGLLTSVTRLGQFLNIPLEHIYAVNIQFNAQGKYTAFDLNSPLVRSQGKRVIIDNIRKTHADLGYVGDGLNDLEVKDKVTRFIGYGGIYYRENIRAACEYYVKSASMAAILPLVLTAEEVHLLTDSERELYQKGVTLNELLFC